MQTVRLSVRPSPIRRSPDAERRTAVSKSASPLIRLTHGRVGPPLFMIHGLGGTFLELVRLAELVNYAGPIYGFRAKGDDGSAAPLSTVDAMAEYYAEAIRALQPEGPYYVCGYSFGGVVAVETARCLKRRQQEIALLVLIESYADRRLWPLRARLGALRCRLRCRIAKLLNQPALETIAYFAGKLTPLAAKAARLARLTRADISSEPRLPKDISASRKVYEAETHARDSYQPRFYPGKITFLKPDITNYGFPPDPALIWGPLCEELEIHGVPGDHRTMILAHADSIAAYLKSWLPDSTKA